MKTFFLDLLNWVIFPAVVIYGYYYGNEACMSITILYLWIMFIFLFFINILLGLILLADTDLDLKDKKKLKAILKFNNKLKSKWFSFTTSVGFILYLGLAILIASTGSIWIAFMFILTFVVLKYVLLVVIKKIILKIMAIIEEEYTEELLNIVRKGDKKEKKDENN